MEGIGKVVVAFCLVLGLAGCTCTLAGCTSAEAKTGQESRFEVEFYESHGPSFAHMAVDLITDTETDSIDRSL